MKLILKILLFIFVANVKVTSATITFPNIQEATVYSSFHTEMPKTVLKVIENDLMNCCQNEKDLVDYRDWGKGVEAVAAKTSSNLWKVGSYSELQGLEAGLQAHHVGQKSLMSRLVPGYNPADAPSILVPEIGHVTNMPGIGRVAATRGLGGFTNARQVLARDIFELRRVYGSQGIPNSSLQQLIQMNKTMYPGAFIK